MMKNVLNCPKCRNTYDLPILLPCGHSLCKRHETEAREERSRVLCHVCKASYEIPEHGFTVSVILQMLIDKKLATLDLGPDYKAAVHSTDSFRHLLDEFKEMVLQPEAEIDRLVSEMRARVDLRREEAKKSIDDEAIALIHEINEFEAKCKAGLLNDDKENGSSFAQTNMNAIRLFEKDVKTWEDALSAFEDPKIWRAIHLEGVKRCETLSKRMKPLKRKLFTESLSQLETRKKKFCQESAEPLVQIKCLVTNLEKSRTIKTPTCYKHGVEWYLEVEYKPAEDDVSVYLHVSYSTKSRVLFIDSELVILNTVVPSDNLTRDLRRECPSKTGSGYASFIPFSVLKADNMLFNSSLNSFTVQANVNDIKWIQVGKSSSSSSPSSSTSISTSTTTTTNNNTDSHLPNLSIPPPPLLTTNN